ncbi:MAG: hypothetical protein AAFN04_04235 [Pseudomonadota bacterium]
MREMGCMFMVLTFLAGITVSTVPVALINVVVFFALSLGVLHFFGERLGKQGLAFRHARHVLRQLRLALCACAVSGRRRLPRRTMHGVGLYDAGHAIE